jgi:hypothetical protein
VRRAKCISGPLLCRFILAHSDADHILAGAEVLGVPSHMVGVVAERCLEPSHDVAGRPVRFALDVNACKSLVAVKYVAAVRSEAGPLLGGAVPPGGARPALALSPGSDNGVIYTIKSGRRRAARTASKGCALNRLAG